MMRFLVVYSTAGFWFKTKNVENHSKNSEKKSKKFFQLLPDLNHQKASERPVGCTF